MSDRPSQLWVLGAALLDAEAANAVVRRLTISHFENDADKALFRVLKRMHQSGLPISVDTVISEGADALHVAFVYEAVPTAATVDYHIDQVVAARHRRRLQSQLDDHDLAGMRETLEELTTQAEGLPWPVKAKDADSTPPEFLVRSLIPKREPTLIFADGGVGKSSVAWHIAAAMALGEDVFGQFPVHGPGPVLYISEEDGEAVIQNRLRAMAVGHGWDAERLLDRFHILAMHGARTDVGEWQDHLINVVKTLGCVLVVFDPYAELTTASENSDENKVNIRFFRRLVSETGVSLVVVHHAGKPDLQGLRRSEDRVRGWSGIRDSFRAIHFLEKAEGGMSVRPIKVSRSEIPPRFRIRREIEIEVSNPAVWKSARFTYVGEEASKAEGARKFILAVLPLGPGNGGPNSGMIRGELRREWNKEQGLKVNVMDVSKVLGELEGEGVISFEEGTRQNEKSWYQENLPKDSGQDRQVPSSNLPKPAGQDLKPVAEPALSIEEAGSTYGVEPLGRIAVGEVLGG